MTLSPEEFAIMTGASVGFVPPHEKEWRMFWKQDICEKYEFNTAFPRMGLSDAQTVWRSMEKHYFDRYDDMLRVWPEWCSSGIWSPPYPGSRSAGGMVDYQNLPLRADLVGRFEAWQAVYDESPPCGSVDLDWDDFNRVGMELARELKRSLGPRVYVEYRQLIEVLMDGTTRSWRPILGLVTTADE
jgi:hypothetical protein